MEELRESDVMWPDGDERRPCDAHKACSSSSRARTRTTSAPVAIPRARGAPVVDEERETELVPPHVLASRGRTVGKAAFSLCTGQGRTLKGRDLSHVRNSVLRMTGFLEG
ncbi:protein S40-1-like [Musa acuminata AAA Group]|uniref:protein S40-1-like n=1 Tax=Musa acuminata AAA Group TaxID=214697 RepID=UPI0031DCD7B7